MAMSYRTPEATKYKKNFAKYVRSEAKRQKWNHTPNKHQHFYVDTVFYFDRMDKDCSNYFKVMLDAITDAQVVWLDDNVACERVQRIYYDSQNPRIEITIHPVEYIGVFNNTSQMEIFISKCIECTRYLRNCSILKKAKEGRVQDEINEGCCLKYKKKKG